MLKNIYNQIVQGNKFQVFVFFLIFIVFIKLIYLIGSTAWWFDEFFYIEGGNTIANGGVLYRDLGDIKPPGIFFLIAGMIKIFGYENSLFSLKLITILFQTTAAFFLFLILEKTFDKKIAFANSLLFLVLISICYKFWSFNVTGLFFLSFLISIYFLIKTSISQLQSALNHFYSGFFLGLTYLLSTNVIIYILLYPLIGFVYKKKLKCIFFDSLTASIGFLFPLCAIFLYFYVNDSLYIWYWWNYKWAIMYSNHNEGPLLIALLGNPFVTLIFNWELLGFYLLFIVSSIYFFKTWKINKENKFYLFILIFMIVSFIARSVLRRPDVIFNSFLFISMIFFISFYLSKNTFSRKIKRLSILLLILGLLANNYFAYQNRYDEKIAVYDDVYQFVKSHTECNDKIYVWAEGGGFLLENQ